MVSLTRRGAFRMQQTVGLFLILLLLSARLLISTAHQGMLETERSPLLYQAATLGFNYFDFGFVRRGLGGSAVHLIGGNPLRATAIFHLLSAASVAAAACWFFARLERPTAQRATFALLLVALMMRWAEDPGRTDMAVAAIIGLAAIALHLGRPVVACLGVAIGLAIHETSFVFGIPLLVGLALDQDRWPRISRSAALGALAVLGATFLLYLLLDRLPHVGMQTMVDAVRSRFPRTDQVDLAIYYAISGSRGVRTSICQNFQDPAYLVHVCTGLLIIALFIGLLRARGSAFKAAMLVSIPPFLFLSFVANDISRWAMMAAFNVWLLSASNAVRLAGGAPRSGVWASPGLALLVILLIHPRTYRVEFPMYVPTPIIERIVQELGGPRTPGVAVALEKCDPEWRSLLGQSLRP